MALYAFHLVNKLLSPYCTASSKRNISLKKIILVVCSCSLKCIARDFFINIIFFILLHLKGKKAVQRKNELKIAR